MTHQASSTMDDQMFHDHKLHTEARDFAIALSGAIGLMLDEDAVGGVIAIKAGVGVEFWSHEQLHSLLDADDLLAQVQDAELILFDGGNIHGDSWKICFYPRQMIQTFVSEN